MTSIPSPDSPIQLSFDDYGLCACGCGNPTPLHKRTNVTLGYVEGRPRKFLNGHATRLKDPVVRFMRSVQKTDTCWLWQASIRPEGYGQFSWSRRTPDGVVRTVERAHRFAYEAFVGPIPDGLLVCHHCDNPPCVNPDHLFLGTHSDNNLDMVRKGRSATGDRSGPRKYPERMPRGEKQWCAKLREADIPQIRALLRQGVAMRTIGMRFRVSGGTIKDIKEGKTWKHVPDE